MSIRAFVAVELDDALRRDVTRVQHSLRTEIDRAAPDARLSWVNPSTLHLTLKFLGNVDESRLDAFREAVSSATRDCHPVVIPLNQLGGFPRLKEPRNLWLGPPDHWTRSADADRVRALADAIDRCSESLGVPRESRPFSPHLTLARVRAGERQVGRALTTAGAMAAASPEAALTLSSFTLMESHLHSNGAVHTSLWTLTLRSSNRSMDR